MQLVAAHPVGPRKHTICSVGHRSLLPIQQAKDPSSILSRPQMPSATSAGPRCLQQPPAGPRFLQPPYQAPEDLQLVQ